MIKEYTMRKAVLAAAMALTMGIAAHAFAEGNGPRTRVNSANSLPPGSARNTVEQELVQVGASQPDFLGARIKSGKAPGGATQSAPALDRFGNAVVPSTTTKAEDVAEQDSVSGTSYSGGVEHGP